MLVWTGFATAQALVTQRYTETINPSHEAFAGLCSFSFLGSFTLWWYCKISDSLVLVKVACEIWGVCYSRGIMMPTSWALLFFMLLLVRPFSACSFWGGVVGLGCKPEVEVHLFTCCAAFCSWYPSFSTPRLGGCFHNSVCRLAQLRSNH